jgi:glycosyltransferase involved in cell wall biosynthesis
MHREASHSAASDIRISVVIPAYNAAKTISATLDSVFRQTLPPFEILVLNDASTDETATILARYADRLEVCDGQHRGAAEARNQLCRRARGDLIAFLDADDLWHPEYLSTQAKLFRQFPEAVGFFTGHILFDGDREFTFNDSRQEHVQAEAISALDFLFRYNSRPGIFGTSYCCVPKSALVKLGSDPFQVNTAEDWFFFNCLSLLGPVVYFPEPLAVYRIQPGSLSSNRMRLSRAIIQACETVEPRFANHADPRFLRVFRDAFAEKRRIYAKLLIHRRNFQGAREQLRLAAAQCQTARSKTKTLVILASTYFPPFLQPDWLAKYPQWKNSFGE